MISILIPPSLTERVLTEYPTPIALPYRRFHEARFNIYERVLRLRDLFEATSFFLYNVTLADTLRRLDPQLFYVANKGARKAYNYYSMKDRLDYIEEIITISERIKGSQYLFIPELAEVGPVIRISKSLQDDLRNPLSHTAAASEERQKRLLENFQPMIEDMLSKLEFLAAYRLVRIPFVYFSRNKWIRQTEIYRGVTPTLDEITLAGEIEMMKADRDHLVLLNDSEEILDLFPLYQLLATAETRDEKHLCFFKQRKAEERRLEGESIPGIFSINLEGFDDFEALRSKFSDP